MHDPRYEILFDKVEIGPVTAPNRFYQVPHCTGMGRQRPHTLAAMRGIKAQGGWGVVCTEYCSIHPSSDDAAFPFATLWDDSDIHANALMVDAVHEHGALAGVELWLGGSDISNHDTRLPPIGLQSRPGRDSVHPGQSKRMDKQDIKNVKRWQVDAAKRAVTAGFDIIYVYATHGYLLSEFLDPRLNTRTDEYGGSLENRVRIIRELIELTRDAVAGNAAVATRFSVDLADSETYDAFGLLAELPDLWDLTVNDYDVEMATSRFQPEAALTGHVAKARQLTSKPVVCVGRYTSPDTMVSVIKKGQQDLIGAARPSIADPFLPQKIRQGRVEDIRECIGCNVCYAYDGIGVPLRCTQNPTFGEEWRRGWHPEKIPTTYKPKTPERVLVVGAGPAGLEAARVLGERGFIVMLADARREFGGRVTIESRLPGLAAWGRVRDWRLTQLNRMANVEQYLESLMNKDDVLNCEADHVLLATGASWVTDGTGRHRQVPFKGHQSEQVVSVDDLLEDNHEIGGHYVVYDDDHYYPGPLLTKKLIDQKATVTFVTPAGRPCAWGDYTTEQDSSNIELYRSGASVITNHCLEKIENNEAVISCIYTNEQHAIKCNHLLPVTQRQPNDALYQELLDDERLTGSITLIGDAQAPGIIAFAVYSGYKAGLELMSNNTQAAPEATIPPVLRDLPG